MVCGRMQRNLIEKSWLILGYLSFIDQGGALDVATRLRAGRSGVRIPVATRVLFSLIQNVQAGSGPTLAPCNGYRNSSPGIKLLEREVNRFNLVPTLRITPRCGVNMGNSYVFGTFPWKG